MSAYSDLILADGAVAYWRFGEISGTVAADEVGSKNMTYVGSPTLAAPGLLVSDDDTAVGLNGSAQYIRGTAGGLTSVLNGAPAITFEAWVNLDAAPVSGVQYLFRTAINGGSGGINVFTTNIGSLNVGGRSVSTDPWQNIGATIDFGRPVHVVGIMNFANDKIEIYLDGVQAAQQTINFANTAYTVGSPTFLDAIGADADGLTSYLVGVIDEVALYDRALTPAEILEHYTVGTTVVGVSLSGLVTSDGGLPVKVVVWDWSTKAMVSVVDPDVGGYWSLPVEQDTYYGITYLADGCEPVTHGPYLGS